MIYVCPLSRLAQTVQLYGARHVVSLINLKTQVPRPVSVPDSNHLFLGMNDITELKDGHVLPEQTHIASLVDFVANWDRTTPLVIHCWAGVSRSPAAAFVSLCALAPAADEMEIAEILRTASPTATPNARIVALGDQLLNRSGRMIRAIEKIGRGQDTQEGEPFRLDVP